MEQHVCWQVEQGGTKDGEILWRDMSREHINKLEMGSEHQEDIVYLEDRWQDEADNNHTSLYVASLTNMTITAVQTRTERKMRRVVKWPREGLQY